MCNFKRGTVKFAEKSLVCSCCGVELPQGSVYVKAVRVDAVKKRGKYPTVIACATCGANLT